MYKSDYAIYLGTEDEVHIVEFFIEENIYIILELEDRIEKEDLRSMFKPIKAKVEERLIESLDEFEKIIKKEISKKLKSSTYSLAAGILVDNVFYLLTEGKGQILVHRGGMVKTIIQEDNKASGYVKEADIFVFASGTFCNLLKVETLNDYIGGHSPKEIIEDITPAVKKERDIGAIALFLELKKEVSPSEDLTEEGKEGKEVVKAPIWERLKSSTHFAFIKNLKENLVGKSTPKGKRITTLLVVILAFIFLWSVVFGFQRRAHNEIMKKVKAKSELIDTKLSEASDISSLNLERSLILIKEAKSELEDLKKTAGDKKITQIEELEKKISEKEKEIVKKDERPAEEFYDLALIEKDALGEKMYLDGEGSVILNPDTGKIYTLSLTKKSIRVVKASEIKGADLVALYNEDIVFLNKDKGIYKITSDSKSKKVIKKDEDWGNLVGVWIYNGNLYFLDSEKDEIYKYLVAEESYSSKSSYFQKGQAIDLSNANSLAIDSDVYIGTKTGIYKYTGGIRQEFNTKFPEEDEKNFTKIFTDKNNNKVYVLEKDKGKVYILNKNGTYERQIESSIFKKASDFVVLESEKKIYVLVSDKIYTVGIE